MKEFLVYTGLRLGLFVSAFVIVAGIWALASDQEVNLIWPLLIAMLVSAVASAYLLKGPRERLAARIEDRARRASAKFEEMRGKEDVD
jgi:mannitol-specific phosphotransferase system IIBC component